LHTNNNVLNIIVTHPSIITVYSTKTLVLVISSLYRKLWTSNF